MAEYLPHLEESLEKQIGYIFVGQMAPSGLFNWALILEIA